MIKTRDPWKKENIKTMESYTGSPTTSLNKNWGKRKIRIGEKEHVRS